jgi:hypothetical protein
MRAALFVLSILMIRWAWRLARSPVEPRWLRRLEPLFPVRGRWLRYLAATTTSLLSLPLWLPMQARIPVGSGLLLVGRYSYVYTCCRITPDPPQGFSLTQRPSLPTGRRLALRVEDELFFVEWVPNQ